MTPMIKQFLETALWSEVNDDGEPLDQKYTLADLHPSVVEQATEDCEDFLTANLALLNQANMPFEDVGHNFLLSRNNHGAGFWDRGLGEIGEALTKASKPYGSFHLYIGDDGKIYCHG